MTCLEKQKETRNIKTVRLLCFPFGVKRHVRFHLRRIIQINGIIFTTKKKV